MKGALLILTISVTFQNSKFRHVKKKKKVSDCRSKNRAL